MDSSTELLLDGLCSPAQPIADVREADVLEAGVLEASGEADVLEASCLHQGFLQASLLESPGLLPASHFEHVAYWEQGEDTRSTGVLPAQPEFAADTDLDRDSLSVHHVAHTECSVPVVGTGMQDIPGMTGLEDSLTMSMLEQALGPMDEALHLASPALRSPTHSGVYHGKNSKAMSKQSQYKRRSQETCAVPVKCVRADASPQPGTSCPAEVSPQPGTSSQGKGKNESDCVPPTPPGENEDTFTALKTQIGRLASPLLRKGRSTRKLKTPVSDKKRSRKTRSGKCQTQGNNNKNTSTQGNNNKNTSTQGNNKRSATTKSLKNTSEGSVKVKEQENVPAGYVVCNGIPEKVMMPPPSSAVSSRDCQLSPVDSTPPTSSTLHPHTIPPLAEPFPNALTGSQAFCIIDVAASTTLFDHFLHEWKSQESYGLSLACCTSPTPGAQQAASIGAQFADKHPGMCRTAKE